MGSILRPSLSLLAVIAMMISPTLCPCLAGELNSATRSKATTNSSSGPVHSCCRNKSATSEQAQAKTQMAIPSHSIPTRPSAPGSGCLCQAHASSACLESRDLPVNISPDYANAIALLSASADVFSPARTAESQRAPLPFPLVSGDRSLLRQHCLCTV